VCVEITRTHCALQVCTGCETSPRAVQRELGQCREFLGVRSTHCLCCEGWCQRLTAASIASCRFSFRRHCIAAFLMAVRFSTLEQPSALSFVSSM